MKIHMLAVITAASFAWVGVGPVAAQDNAGEQMAGCVKKTRDSGNGNNIVKVRTIVENKANKEYKVAIYDGSTKLAEDTINENENVEANDSKMSGNKPEFKMKILVETDDKGTIPCYYDVTAEKVCNQEGGNCWARSTWSYWSEYSEACPSSKLTIACDKTFKPNQDRWITTFTIEGD